VIVEGTAGNTGIGLTLVAKALGYRTVIVIPETQSQEKKDALRLLGAELVEVPAVPYKNPNNYVKVSGRLAEQLAKTEPNGAIWANQFDNVANREAHIETTAPEIWNDTSRQGRWLHLLGRFRRHAGRRRAGPEGVQQGHQDRHRRSGWRGALRILQDRRAEIRRFLDHRRHRPGPDHRQPRRLHAEFAYQISDERSPALRVRSCGARRALPRWLHRINIAGAIRLAEISARAIPS
jgi:NADPH:quinone reductase-like Zn-dependent oxidoreductase